MRAASACAHCAPCANDWACLRSRAAPTTRPSRTGCRTSPLRILLVATRTPALVRSVLDCKRVSQDQGARCCSRPSRPCPTARIGCSTYPEQIANVHERARRLVHRRAENGHRPGPIGLRRAPQCAQCRGFVVLVADCQSSCPSLTLKKPRVVRLRGGRRGGGAPAWTGWTWRLVLGRAGEALESVCAQPPLGATSLARNHSAPYCM